MDGPLSLNPKLVRDVINGVAYVTSVI